MNVLIVGSGGREHALAWAVSRSPQRPKLFAAPGNAGIHAIGRTVPLRASDTEGLLSFAQAERIDLTIVGPEVPLVSGIVDRFRDHGLKIFGPRKREAQLEGSKIFAKELMNRAGIPTAPYKIFAAVDDARESLRGASYPLVVKADGLAAGKGVVIARDRGEAMGALERIMVDRRFGSAGERILIEEFLDGEEVSILALCRGTRYTLLPASQDHKRLQDGDLGPNTGGMGAYAPYPRWNEAFERRVRRGVVEPTLDALQAAGSPYHGLLYCGILVRNGDPFVLEYNCRFGDPETQAVIPLMTGDLLDALDVIATASEGPIPEIGIRSGAAVGVVLASTGYPASYEKGFPIAGVEKANALPETLVFHAGTRMGPLGPLTDGGRVLTVVGTGQDLRGALGRAYEGVRMIDFEGKTFRTDIARRGLPS